MRAGIVEQRYGRSCSGTERCGCPWRYRVDGPEGLDGKRRQVTEGRFPNKTTAREALVAMQRRIGNGEVVGKSVTVETYLTGWLETKAGVLRPATIAQYRDLSARFLVPLVGRVKLADLRAEHVEAMLTAMTEQGRGLVTRRRTVAVLSSALSSAVKRRLVTWNVCQQLELAPERPERRPVWDAAELTRFIGHVSTDRLAALWRLYAIVGLRRGEALALRWSEVDIEAGSLRIERTLSEIGGHLVWGAPKTSNGRRTIALDAETVSLLCSHRACQSAERLALGEAYRDNGLVFCRQDGEPIWPGTVSSGFHDVSKTAGLTAIRLHDYADIRVMPTFRKSCCSPEVSALKLSA